MPTGEGLRGGLGCPSQTTQGGPPLKKKVPIVTIAEPEEATHLAGLPIELRPGRASPPVAHGFKIRPAASAHLPRRPTPVVAATPSGDSGRW